MIPINRNARALLEGLRDTFLAIDEVNGLENHRSELAQQIEALKKTREEAEADIRQRYADAQVAADTMIAAADEAAEALKGKARAESEATRLEAEAIMRQARDTAEGEAAKALALSGRVAALEQRVAALNEATAAKAEECAALDKRIADARAAAQRMLNGG